MLWKVLLESVYNFSNTISTAANINLVVSFLNLYLPCLPFLWRHAKCKVQIRKYSQQFLKRPWEFVHEWKTRETFVIITQLRIFLSKQGSFLRRRNSRAPDNRNSGRRCANFPNRGTEPEFVNLLTGIDSQPGGPVQQPYLRTGPLGYIGWRNRFLGSINAYKYGLRSPVWGSRTPRTLHTDSKLIYTVM